MATQMFITDILKSLKGQYLELVSDAVSFFRDFEDIYLAYERETKRTKEINKQVETILAFKENNGVYPTIKDQPDAEAYLKELKQLSASAQEKLDIVEPKIRLGYKRRNAMLKHMADTIIEQNFKKKDANRFITSMVLRAPLPSDQSRCVSNEKNKPIYIAALSLQLLEDLISKNLVAEEHILNHIPSSIPAEDDSEIDVPDPEMLDDYKKEVLRPIVYAALIHQLGSYSKEADKIYNGNRYRLLNEKERTTLIDIIFNHSRNYLKYGLGEPERELFNEINPEAYPKAVARYDLMDTLLTNYTKSQHPLGNLLRIPMIYASFLMSTKSRHNYTLIYKAYDILQSGVDKKVMYPPYTKVFMDMVGRYPLGSGVYFISKETHSPEKAVVVGLNPDNANTAIIKQTTKRQVKYEDHSQTKLTFDYNLFNPEARKASNFSEDYYKKQFPRGYFWNPSEEWEMEINQKSFWRRDNKIRRN